MTRLYNVYNGIKDPLSIEWLTKTYGQENKAKFIAYRLGRTKIDLLQGEWLKRPLQSTVTTINSEAVTDKMEQFYFLKGAMISRNEIAAVKDKAGVDVMEGIEIPENDDVFGKMKFKDKCEDVMQLIVDKAVVHLDVKKKLSESFLDCEITNHAHFMIELNQKGDVEIHKIDPRDAIYEVIQGDDYIEHSPVRGCRRVMPVHEILLRYDLSKEDRDKLEAARQSPNAYIGSGGLSRGYMDYVNGELLCDVIHIEWDSVTPMYTKVVPKTQSQLLIDPSPDPLTFEMDTTKYETNKEYHDKNVAKGEYQIVTKYMEQRYEATRIGGIIDINRRKVPNKKRSIDNPSEILSSTYVSYIHGRVNGTSVSLQQIIENFDNLYDIAMYQKNRELAKGFGKILTIDRSAIGPKDSLKDTYYRMANDQVLEYDSSAAGNLGGRQLDPAMMFKQLDLGIGESIAYYDTLCQNISNQISQITGINENRQGITAASSTATAQQSDIANSRTITEALFYGYSGFVKRVMKAIVDKSAISYAFYKTEEGEQVLGAERFAFLKATVDLAYRDYNIEIEDGSRYMEIAGKIEKMMEVSLNAKEIRMMDALNVLLAETVAQKRQFLVSAWEDMSARMEKQQQMEQESMAQMQQQQLETQLQIAKEDREDRQAAEQQNIVTKGQVEIEVNRAKAESDSVLLNQKINGDIITKTQPPDNPL
ncbi:MAG: hypothetical protein WC055_02080 [Melioribacteraceae bacterium]